MRKEFRARSFLDMETSHNSDIDIRVQKHNVVNRKDVILKHCAGGICFPTDPACSSSNLAHRTQRFGIYDFSIVAYQAY